jgi:2-hydroxy-3-oxopropionate reductase
MADPGVSCHTVIIKSVKAHIVRNRREAASFCARQVREEKSVMKVGFVGLGIMGRPMAENLLKAGYELTVFGHHADVNQELADHGAYVAGSNKEVAQRSEVVITMVQNSPQVRDAVFGREGLAEGFRAGESVLIDMSSIDPVESRKIADELGKIGVDMMDCPVSGGEPKAIDGTLSVMCGGKKETFDRYYDLLMAMAGSAVYVGSIGAGNVAKLANQMIVAANIGIVSEALTFARKAGTDPELVYKAIRGGLAGSTVLDAKAPMMLSGNYKPGFRIDLHIKDLTNALNASHAINMPVPMTAHMMEVMQELKNHGEGGCDHDDIVRYYERMSGTSIAKKDD